MSEKKMGGGGWGQIPVGTLVDTDIIQLASDGLLITGGFEQSSVKQACYELHASDIFYDPTLLTDDKKVEANPEGYVLRPHCYVTAIVRESIELPANVVARVLAKGQLFSVGILPVSTYADPGFSGRLGITLYNFSHRHIVFKPGQAIAKIEFSCLPKPVERPYHGQHGYETEIWPIPFGLYAKPEQLRAAKIEPMSLGEIERTEGPVVAELTRRLHDTEHRLKYYERRVWVQIGVTILAFSGLFWLGVQGNWFEAVFLGVGANLLTSFVLHLGANRTRKASV